MTALGFETASRGRGPFAEIGLFVQNRFCADGRMGTRFQTRIFKLRGRERASIRAFCFCADGNAFGRTPLGNSALRRGLTCEGLCTKKVRIAKDRSENHSPCGRVGRREVRARQREAVINAAGEGSVFAITSTLTRRAMSGANASPIGRSQELMASRVRVEVAANIETLTPPSPRGRG
jgi:hypothetical protein